MSNVLHNVSTEYQNTHFVFNNFADIRAIYEIMWKHLVLPDKPQITI